MRRSCEALTGATAQTPGSHQALINALHRELPHMILQAFLSGTEKQSAPISLERQRALRLSMEAIRDSDETIWRVSDLCRRTGVGERTLRYAFAENWGISPKAYLQSRRLNAVRRALRDGRADSVIADIANDHEFWHMGQFAADYRKMFGELPSVTLKRERDTD